MDDKVIQFPLMKDTASNVLSEFYEIRDRLTGVIIVAKDTEDDILASISDMDVFTAMYLAQSLNTYVLDKIDNMMREGMNDGENGKAN